MEAVENGKSGEKQRKKRQKKTTTKEQKHKKTNGTPDPAKYDTDKAALRCGFAG